MLPNNNEIEMEKNTRGEWEDGEDENTLGYDRIMHNYLQREIIIPTLEPYRTKEIDYRGEFDLEKNNKFLTYEDKKKHM